MPRLTFPLAVLVLISASWLSIATYRIEVERRAAKDDLVELSKIKYGLFSVDEWKKILAEIITKKIQQFNLEGANRKKVKKELEAFLIEQLSELEQRYYEKKSRSIWGLFVQTPIAVLTGVFNKIK